MAQAGVSLTKLYWNRSCSAGSTLLLLLQKMFFTLFALKLMVPLFIVSTGSVSRAHGQTTSAHVSSSAPGQPDLPEAPSASPTPEQSSQSNIPFLSPRFNQPHQPMDTGNKFKYFVEPAFGPRSFLTNAFSTGIRIANPPSRYPHDWRAGGEAFGRNYGDSFALKELKALGVSPLPFCCTKIFGTGALKVPSFLRAWAMRLSSPLSIEQTGAIAQLPYQTSPAPQLAVLLAMHTFPPASIT
jgi:hypothetical protein